MLKELLGRLSVGCHHEWSDGKLVSAVASYKEKELALVSLHLGNVDVEDADGVALELVPLGFVAFDCWQPLDPMTLDAPVQRRPRQVWDGRLKGVKAVFQRQQRVAPKRNHCRLFVFGQHS